MKKMLVLIVLSVLMLGCVSLEVGDSRRFGTKTYTRVTESGVRKITDSITLQNYYEASSVNRGSAILTKSLDVTANYIEETDKFLLYFTSIGSDGYNGKDRFLRSVLFSNGKQVATVSINNLSSIDTHYQTYQEVSLQKRKVLYEIFDSGLPITMRVTTNTRIFDVNFNDKFRPGMLDILKMSLKIPVIAQVQ